jgi:hypothetical protein
MQTASSIVLVAESTPAPSAVSQQLGKGSCKHESVQIGQCHACRSVGVMIAARDGDDFIAYTGPTTLLTQFVHARKEYLQMWHISISIDSVDTMKG